MPLEAADVPEEPVPAQALARSLQKQGGENSSLPGVAAQTHVLCCVWLTRILANKYTLCSHLENQRRVAA